MLTLLLGSDNYSKKQYIKTISAKEKAEIVFLIQPEILNFGELLGQDLFAKKRVFAIEGGIKHLNETNAPEFIKSPNNILFLEEKVDKRINFNKNLLTNKQVIVNEFTLPHGKELNTWITSRVKELGANISAPAVEALALHVGRDESKETKFGGRVVDVKEIYNLLDVDNEIHKLIAYASGEVIEQEMVKALVPERKEADVLDIVNAIGENDKVKWRNLMEVFLASETSSDEKGKIIQLNALLSEQFRNVAIVQDFLQNHVPDNRILEQTEWKSGRLFIIKKIASKFSSKKVLELLNKLSLLDQELKTTSTPPRVLLDLIFSQL